MIQQIGKRAKRSTRVLIAILTDGGENSSRKFSQDDVMRMIAYRCTTYDWQFIFIGPEDALPYALSIGIQKSYVVAFNADLVSLRLIMSRLKQIHARLSARRSSVYAQAYSMNHYHQIRVAALRLQRYSRRIKDKIWSENRSELTQALSDTAKLGEIARRLYAKLQDLPHTEG